MALILVSRLPYLDYGYGAEEDAWGLYIAVKNMVLSSRYEVSRLPGHPVQELFYGFMWNAGSYAFNLTTAIFSSLGIGFFVAAMRNIGIRYYFLSGLILAFTPIIYIDSTNSMDYTWALCFSMASWFLVTERKFVLAGIAIGLATGCRITSMAMILPMLFFIYDSRIITLSLKNIFAYVSTAVISAIVVFAPVWLTYGIEFFTFYKHWPYPPVLQSLYKFTVAPWGVIGFFDMCSAFLILLLVVIRGHFFILNFRGSYVIAACLSGIALFTISFWLVPFKPSFVIPIIPFLVLLLSIYLRKIQLQALCFSLLISCFFVGLNLNEPHRSATPSSMSYDLPIGGQNLKLDLWNGPLKEDISKRINRTYHAQRILNNTDKLIKPAVVISGYWYNFIEGQKHALLKDDDVRYVYYIDAKHIRDFKNGGFTVYYLTDQEALNDLRFRDTFTRELALEFNLQN